MAYHDIPLPDFRYVSLLPGLSPLPMTLATVGASTGLTGALIWATGADTISLLISTLAGGIAALTMYPKGAFRLLNLGRTRSIAMAIVPWGILIQPDSKQESRVLRWDGVHSIHVDSFHITSLEGSSSGSWNLVTIETRNERLLGRIDSNISLARLLAHLPSYAHESSLPIAMGIDGLEQADILGFEPTVRVLLQNVRSYLETAESVEVLSLLSGTYRTISSCTASQETIDLLKRQLQQSPEGETDRRAFCAILAGELGLKELLPELLRLIMTPHPRTAAIAKAAALRLGADPTQTGAIEEIAWFLHEDDLLALKEWAEGENIPASKK